MGVRRNICKTYKMHVFVFSAKSSFRFNPLPSVKDSHLNCCCDACLILLESPSGGSKSARSGSSSTELGVLHLVCRFWSS